MTMSNLDLSNYEDFDEMILAFSRPLLQALSLSAPSSSLKLEVTEEDIKEAKRILKEYGPDLLTSSEQREVEGLLGEGLSVDEVVEQTGFPRESVEGIYELIFVPRVFDVVYSPDSNLSGIVLEVTGNGYEVLWRDGDRTLEKIWDGRKYIVDGVREVLDRNIEKY